MTSSAGSLLIMVLWVLVLIGFLAGEYLDHNRQKASLATGAWDKLRQTQAVESVLALFSVDTWPLPGQKENKGVWNRVSPDGVEMWVRVDDESNRININNAQEGQIRDKIRTLLGDELEDEADQMADAILDWRDHDSDTRKRGAEAGFYQSNGLSYRPANGPFKVLTELLLVRGVTQDIFWGNPIIGPLAGEGKQAARSLIEDFTIYPKEEKRVSIVAPGRQNSYNCVVALLEKKSDRWDVVNLYQAMLINSDLDMQSSDSDEGLH